MRSTCRLPALLVAGMLWLLVGCGAGPGGREPASTPSGTAEALSAVRDAAAQTDAEGSARYVLSTATRVGGQDVVLAGDGAYDWGTGKGRTTYEIPGGRVEQRLLGDSVFFVLPQQPGVFFRVPTAQVAATPIGGTVDPTAQLLALAAADSAERLGEQQVRGEPTTHYRGRYDLARAVELAEGTQRDALRSSLGAAAGVAPVPFDAYVDDDGRLRRLTQTVEVPTSPPVDGEALSVTTTLELYDFGTDVVVPGPPADMIRDGAPLLAALRTALPGATEPATPPAGASPSPAAR